MSASNNLRRVLEELLNKHPFVGCAEHYDRERGTWVTKCACGVYYGYDNGSGFYKHIAEVLADLDIVKLAERRGAHMAMWQFFLTLPMSPFSDMVQLEALRLRNLIEGE